MHDASAKIPSGVLNGNLNQLGDFDQCVNAASPDARFTGKYCLAHIQLKVPKQFARLATIRKLVQSHDAFVNDFDDVSGARDFRGTLKIDTQFERNSVRSTWRTQKALNGYRRCFAYCSRSSLFALRTETLRPHAKRIA